MYIYILLINNIYIDGLDAGGVSGSEGRACVVGSMKMSKEAWGTCRGIYFISEPEAEAWSEVEGDGDAVKGGMGGPRPPIGAQGVQDDVGMWGVGNEGGREARYNAFVFGRQAFQG